MSGKNNIEFDYDAFGRRVAKHLWTQSDVLVKSTYYILDAQGNQLLTFEHVVEDEESNYQPSERVIYGSSRLGMSTTKVDMLDDEPQEILSLELGNKLYEMSNHLGNVLTVINDIKIPVSSNSVDVDGYLATIVSTADYSPFGVQLDGSTVSAESYRYGFQGQEKDDEIKGAGNSVNYTFRMHDTRLGRFFAVDPLSAKYPYYSPYAFSGNRVIDARELEGLEPVSIHLFTVHSNGSITESWLVAYPGQVFDVTNIWPNQLNQSDVRNGSHLMIWVEDETNVVLYYKDILEVVVHKNIPNSENKSVRRGPLGWIIYKIGGEKAYNKFIEIDQYANTPEGGQKMLVNVWITLATGPGMVGAKGLQLAWKAVSFTAAVDNLTKSEDGSTLISAVVSSFGVDEEAAIFAIGVCKTFIAARNVQLNVVDFIKTGEGYKLFYAALAAYNAEDGGSKIFNELLSPSATDDKTEDDDSN